MVRFFPLLILFLFSFLDSSICFGMKEEEETPVDYPLLNETGKKRREKTSFKKPTSGKKSKVKTVDIIAYLKKDALKVPAELENVIAEHKQKWYVGTINSAKYFKSCRKFSLIDPTTQNYTELITYLLSQDAKRIKLPNISFLKGIGAKIANHILENKLYESCHIDDQSNHNIFNVALKKDSLRNLNLSETIVTIIRESDKKGRTSFSRVSVKKDSEDLKIEKISLTSRSLKEPQNKQDKLIVYSSNGAFNFTGELPFGIEKTENFYPSSECGSRTPGKRTEFFSKNKLDINIFCQFIKNLVDQDAKRILLPGVEFGRIEKGPNPRIIAQYILTQNLYEKCLIHDKNNINILQRSFARPDDLPIIKLILNNEIQTRMPRGITTDNETIWHLMLKNRIDEKLCAKIIAVFVQSGEKSVRFMLNYQNNVGDTALHLACMNDNAPAINFLIKNGVNIDIQNNVGDTALHLACIDGNESAINSLLFNGAKVDIQNSAGRYPLDMLYKKCGSLLNIIGKIRKINDSSTYYIEESFEKKIQKVVKNPKTI